MPSTYTPPDVIVEQVRRTAIANRYAPQMPVVVVGPARLIIVRANSGAYDAGADFDAALPGLTPGGIVDDNSVEVILDARSDAGKQLGLFRLNYPLDAELDQTGTRIEVRGDIALEYSILSLRNNNQIDSIIDDDRATGEPDGLVFHDASIDFLSRGATVNDDSFIIIDTPASMAGRYRIYDMIPTGHHVHTVKVIKVDDEDIPELNKSFAIDASTQTLHPVGRFVYGFPANHELASTHTNQVTGPTVGLGVGVNKIIPIVTGKTTLDSVDLTAILTPANCVIPSVTSGATQWFAPAAPVVPGADQGNNNQYWRAILVQLTVGDWVRISSKFPPGITTLIRDFKVMSIDLVNYKILLQNPDLNPADTSTYTLTLANVDPLDTFTFIEVLKNRNDATFAAGDYFTGVAAGSIPFEVEVANARPGFVEMVGTIPALSTTVDTPIVALRGVPFRGASALYDLTKRITDGFTGNILVSYEADRPDVPLNGLMQIGDQKDIEQQIGMVHPHNPLALMADMVTRSGLTDGNRVFYALATDDNTLEAYQAAMDVLVTEDVYYVVPATQDYTALSIFKQHVEIQSQPQNKHERVLLASTPLVTFHRQVPILNDDPYPVGHADFLNQKVWEAPIDWTLVFPGDVLKIMSGSNQNSAISLVEYRIQTINPTTNSCTLLQVIDPSFIGPDIAHPKNLNFRIDTYPYTKGQQAEDWRDFSASYASFRVMMIRPDVIQIEYTDKTGVIARDRDVIVPMYYGCAVFAGMASAMPPQQPMTNMPIPGIARIFHSNKYFTPDQMNTIAEGGNNLLVQTTYTSLPYSRHQLMTDMTSLITREFSIIKLVDFCAKYIRNCLRPYIGNHNITTEFLTQLRGITESIIRALVQSNVLLNQTRLLSLYQDKDAPDTVVIEIQLDVPYPCNFIHVILYI